MKVVYISVPFDVLDGIYMEVVLPSDRHGRAHVVQCRIHSRRSYMPLGLYSTCSSSMVGSRVLEESNLPLNADAWLTTMRSMSGRGDGGRPVLPKIVSHCLHIAIDRYIEWARTPRGGA